ncbi:sodium-coupled monocarboxylate transporter 1-like [Tribolium madens]|uniref:sodium-coupled monocarboxylate transporter 1-like n=1 Tax=Tribolium madens TaxID=41895 RepID=UPI001CF7348F|nr:sodium-coupled monocarboxylate transporter 1-like [Tribolium madens]XP_044260086.1 sodium-coupled monocarboxylate transporter 1-like [Tribolium madens]
MICVIGLNTTGNFSSLWKTALDGGRLDILNFNLDPTLRDSFWTFMIGYTFQWMIYVNISQSGVQKYLALPTFRQWICDEQGERLHQDIRKMKECYQGRWNPSMMGDYC